MATFTLIISVITVVLVANSTNAYTTLKGRINSVEMRLNYVEARVNTDNLQTRAEISILEESVLSLNSSLTALNDKVDSLPDENGKNQLHVHNAKKRAGTDKAVCDRHREKALILGFISEKKWLKNEIRKTEISFNTLGETTQNRIDTFQKQLKDLQTAVSTLSDTIQREQDGQFKTLSAKMKDIEIKQDDIENKFHNNENLITELKKENANFREEMFEKFTSLHAFLNERLPAMPECSDGWLLFEKQCYFYKKNLERSFPSARDYCRAFNAYIADFGNALESEFILNLTGKVNTWAGISDKKKEGEWISERTNDIVEYMNWRSGDPDGGQGQNCVMLGYRNPWHEWIDRGCENEYQFVCAKNAIRSP